MADQTERAATAALQTGTPGYGAVLRAASLTMAAALVLILLSSPWLFVGEELLVQVVMPVMVLGLAGAVAYGVGYRPRSATLAILLGPWIAWPLMLSSLAILAFRLG